MDAEAGTPRSEGDAPTFRSATEAEIEPEAAPTFRSAAENGVEVVESDRVLEPARPASANAAVEEPELTLADLSQEIRRVGRELFKTNRAAERNQELFESTLEELRQLSAAVSQVHAQSADPVFLAKAALCRELLGVADTLEASRSAAEQVLAQLQDVSEQPAHGLAFRFAAARRLQEGLAGAVDAMGKWADGQALLYERLMAALQSAGVRGVESVGRPFDPAVHRAVSVESRRDVAAGTVIAEELKGYLLDGKILRYGEVVVAKE